MEKEVPAGLPFEVERVGELEIVAIGRFGGRPMLAAAVHDGSTESATAFNPSQLTSVASGIWLAGRVAAAGDADGGVWLMTLDPFGKKPLARQVPN